MMTAMTESAIETFWIEPLQNPINKTSERVVNSKVKSTSSKTGYDNYAFKIIIELENTSLTIYAADIHDTSTKSKDIQINDEMLLAFESESETEKFEQMINHA